MSSSKVSDSKYMIFFFSFNQVFRLSRLINATIFKNSLSQFWIKALIIKGRNQTNQSTSAVPFSIVHKYQNPQRKKNSLILTRKTLKNCLYPALPNLASLKKHLIPKFSSSCHHWTLMTNQTTQGIKPSAAKFSLQGIKGCGSWVLFTPNWRWDMCATLLLELTEVKPADSSMNGNFHACYSCILCPFREDLIYRGKVIFNFRESMTPRVFDAQVCLES